MGTYRLTEDAKSDLKLIYARGLREYGEEQADIYFEDLEIGLGVGWHEKARAWSHGGPKNSQRNSREVSQ